MRACRRDASRRPQPPLPPATAAPARRPQPPPPAPLPSRSALAKLYTPDGSAPRIPVVFMTNGGGMTEKFKAHQLRCGPGGPMLHTSALALRSLLGAAMWRQPPPCCRRLAHLTLGGAAPVPCRCSEWLGVAVDEAQVVLSHTPFQGLVGQLGDEAVLVAGRGQVRPGRRRRCCCRPLPAAAPAAAAFPLPLRSCRCLCRAPARWLLSTGCCCRLCPAAGAGRGSAVWLQACGHPAAAHARHARRRALQACRVLSWSSRGLLFAGLRAAAPPSARHVHAAAGCCRLPRSTHHPPLAPTICLPAMQRGH